MCWHATLTCTVQKGSYYFSIFIFYIREFLQLALFYRVVKSDVIL